MSTLSERDQKHLWHPLTQHKLHANHIPITKAEGALLYDDQGKAYIDGIASWYTCMYGHCNPHIIKKVTAQLSKLDQVVFSGFTHEPAIEMSEALMRILPDNQQKLFFSDNGSTAVDVAIKMALQYHHNLGNKRNVILILMAVELMLLSINFSFLITSTYLDDRLGQIIAIFILTVAAAESSIGLAILVIYFRAKGTINIEFVNLLKG